MSQLVRDDNNVGVQAFRLPISGYTSTVSLAVAGSNISAPLSAGVYRIIGSTDVTVAMGGAATANDMPIRANQPEYFYVNSQSTVSVYLPVGVAGAVCNLTLMP